MGARLRVDRSLRLRLLVHPVAGGRGRGRLRLVLDSSETIENLLVTDPVGVDRRTSVQSATTAVIGEATASLLDDDRRRGMVPDVTGVPDAEVHLTVRNPVLVAPGMVTRTAAGKLLESLLAPRGERIHGGKAGDSVRTRDGQRDGMRVRDPSPLVAEATTGTCPAAVPYVPVCGGGRPRSSA